MSFLDNLENNLKALESRDQGGMEDHKARESGRNRALAAAPWADRLKQSEWTQTLFRDVTRAGHLRRTKVGLIWIGTTLRLEARGHRLELQPAPTGIMASFLHDGEETSRVPVDMEASPAVLIDAWMPVIDAQKKIDDENAKQALAEVEYAFE
jgi:hypothetical protein